MTTYESNLVRHIHITTVNKTIDDKVKSICDYLLLCRCITNLHIKGILNQLAVLDTRLSLEYIESVLDELKALNDDYDN